jgi:Domain of unknown function (DUF5127)
VTIPSKPGQGPGLAYQTGADDTVRSQFVTNGVLLNTQDTNYRAVNDQWPVFALSMDMGNITTATQPWVLSVGHVREPAVQYIVAGNGRQARSLYFWSAFATISDAVSLVFFLYAPCSSHLMNYFCRDRYQPSWVITQPPYNAQ